MNGGLFWVIRNVSMKVQLIFLLFSFPTLINYGFCHEATSKQSSRHRPHTPIAFKKTWDRDIHCNWIILRFYNFKYQVGSQTLSRIKKDNEDVLKRAQENGRRLDQKPIHSFLFPGFGKRLISFVSIVWQAKLPTTFTGLIAKAILIPKKILSESDSEIKIDSI